MSEATPTPSEPVKPATPDDTDDDWIPFTSRPALRRRSTASSKAGGRQEARETAADAEPDAEP